MLHKLIKWAGYTIGFIGVFALLLCLYFHFRISTRENCGPFTLPQGVIGKTIDVGGEKIFYQEMGSVEGTPLILIHGTGSWSEIWKETMVFLSGKGYHVFALDMPPFGFSAKPVGVDKYTTARQAERINGFVASLGLDGTVMVAHSVGAKAGTEAVLNKPSFYRKLILVDPALSFSNDSTVSGFQTNNPSVAQKLLFSNTFVRNSFVGALGTNPSFTKRSFQSFVWNKESVTDERVKMINHPLCIQGVTNAYADWLQNLLCGNSPCAIADTGNLMKLDMPVVLIWGEQDDITPIWQAKRLCSYFPHVSLLTIAQSGHIPYIEAPGEFQDRLAAGLAVRQGE